jgi:hypothetical protein
VAGLSAAAALALSRCAASAAVPLLSETLLVSDAAAALAAASGARAGEQSAKTLHRFRPDRHGSGPVQLAALRAPGAGVSAPPGHAAQAVAAGAGAK